MNLNLSILLFYLSNHINLKKDVNNLAEKIFASKPLSGVKTAISFWNKIRSLGFPVYESAQLNSKMLIALKIIAKISFA